MLWKFLDIDIIISLDKCIIAQGLQEIGRNPSPMELCVAIAAMLD